MIVNNGLLSFLVRDDLINLDEELFHAYYIPAPVKMNNIEDAFMTTAPRSPLAHLVLFMVTLAIAGSCLPGLHWFTVDFPAQNALAGPENGQSSGSGCETCKHNCKIDQDCFECITQCNVECSTISEEEAREICLK